MFIPTIFAPLGAYLTIDTPPNNHTATISAHGDITLVESNNILDKCEFPTSGPCGLADGSQSSRRNCKLMIQFGCPDWEAIVLAGNCILPHADRVCCNEVPRACIKRWNFMKDGRFCSMEPDCIRPSCDQQDFYVGTQYPNYFSNNNINCFFSSSPRAKNGFGCTSSPGVFGLDRLQGIRSEFAPSLESLFQRAEATGATAATTADRTTEEKTDNGVAEGSTVDTGVDTNMPITLDQQGFETDQQTCDSIVARRRVCARASADLTQSRDQCDNCLIEGTQPPPCPPKTGQKLEDAKAILYGAGLDVPGMHYCLCMS